MNLFGNILQANATFSGNVYNSETSKLHARLKLYAKKIRNIGIACKTHLKRKTADFLLTMKKH